MYEYITIIIFNHNYKRHLWHMIKIKQIIWLVYNIIGII